MVVFFGGDCCSDLKIRHSFHVWSLCFTLLFRLDEEGWMRNGGSETQQHALFSVSHSISSRMLLKSIMLLFYSRLHFTSSRCCNWFHLEKGNSILSQRLSFILLFTASLSLFLQWLQSLTRAFHLPFISTLFFNSSIPSRPSSSPLIPSFPLKWKWMLKCRHERQARRLKECERHFDREMKVKLTQKVLFFSEVLLWRKCLSLDCVRLFSLLFAL